MTTNLTTAAIDTAAREIAAKAMSRDRFDLNAAITAQMTQWYGTQRGAQYAETRIQLANTVIHNISEANWRLNVVAEMGGE